jgi:hypothetical protein
MSYVVIKGTYTFWLIDRLLVLNVTFSYIMATSFSGGRSRRELPTMGKQLVNFTTCGCESSAPDVKHQQAIYQPKRAGKPLIKIYVQFVICTVYFA